MTSVGSRRPLARRSALHSSSLRLHARQTLVTLPEPASAPRTPESPRGRLGWAAPSRRAVRGAARSTLREFVVIVAGVLAALAGQAWWQGREDRARERDYLRQLLADTRENERRLDRAIAQDSVSGRAAVRAAAALYLPRPLPPADSLVAWFENDVFNSSAFLPLTGTYQSLLSGDRLRLLRSDALRTRVVAYGARLEQELDALQLFVGQSVGGDPGRLARTLPFLSRTMAGDTGGAGARTAVDFEALRDDPDLRALLFSAQLANRNRLNHLRGLRDETRLLRRTLEAQPELRTAR